MSETLLAAAEVFSVAPQLSRGDLTSRFSGIVEVRFLRHHRRGDRNESPNVDGLSSLPDMQPACRRRFPFDPYPCGLRPSQIQACI